MEVVHEREGFVGAQLWQCECPCGLAGPTELTINAAIVQWNMIAMSADPETTGAPTEEP